MEPDAKDIGEWVKMFADHGAQIVITALAVGLVTWGLVFVIVRLFGKDGLIPQITEKLFGDNGIVERVVAEYTHFVRSVVEVNENLGESQVKANQQIDQANQQIKLLTDKANEIHTTALSGTMVTQALEKQFRDSHDFNVAVIETGMEMAETAANKAGMKDDLQEYIEKIRYLIAAKSAVKHMDHG
jgi:hypothetical protein